MSKPYVVIMAGGIGSRLWPLSTPQKPKQFLDLFDMGKSLLQLTYDRALQITDPSRILVVTNAQWVDLVKAQIELLHNYQIVAEPLRKNTATATLYAINKIANLDPTAEVVVMPSDHIVMESDKFKRTIQQALKYSRTHEDMITIGIKVSRPEVNYGYMQYINDEQAAPVFRVKTFTEKPTQEIANTFHRSGDFLWYSGIKIARVPTMLKMFDALLPDTAQLFEEVRPYLNTDAEARCIEKIYPRCESISFRQALLYKAPNVRVIIGDFSWTDITHWQEVFNVHEKDYMENAVSGNKVAMYDASNCLVEIEGDKVVVINGLDNFIVADSPKGLLIFPRNKEDQLRNIINEVKRNFGDKNF